MKKVILGLLISTGTFSVLAQQKFEFNFSKSVSLNCPTGNILTNGTKKVDVEIANNEAKVTMSSIACKREFKATMVGKFTDKSIGYYDERDNRGIIIENNERMALFSKVDNKYTVTAVGHLDKKTAKEMEETEEQKKYQATFDDFENVMKKGKSDAAAALKVASTLPPPPGEYSDPYGISGLYYLSETSEIINYGPSKPKSYVNTVKFELSLDEYMIKVHYADGAFCKEYISKDVVNALKEKKTDRILSTDGDNMNYVDAFKYAGLLYLEKDLYLVKNNAGVNLKLDCSEPSFTGSRKTNYILVGKNKARVEEVAKDFDKMFAMASASAVKECEMRNAREAAKKPMPEPGLKDAKLNAEVTSATKAKAASAGWAQSVEYCYVTGKEWITLRNKLTGIITGRTIRAVAVMKTKAGSCQWEEIAVSQNFDGANYGSTYFSGNTSIIVPVECAGAMKYK